MDPLRCHAELPLTGTFYPIGFPLEVATNSRDVLDAMREAWRPWGLEFNRPPLRMRVLVSPEGELSEPAVHRLQGHLYSVVSDRHNFAQLDFKELFGTI